MGALLENPAALKSKGIKAALSDIVVSVAVKCGPPHIRVVYALRWRVLTRVVVVAGTASW